jgi:hypothetical protein
MLSMKPIRNALARPGFIRGSDTRQKVRQRSARKRLRRFLHRRADAFDNADQHQKGNRRERQDLCNPDAGQTIEPAPGFDAKQRCQTLRDHAGAAEQQGERQSDDERRGDDRQDGQEAQASS